MNRKARDSLLVGSRDVAATNYKQWPFVKFAVIDRLWCKLSVIYAKKVIPLQNRTINFLSLIRCLQSGQFNSCGHCAFANITSIDDVDGGDSCALMDG